MEQNSQNRRSYSNERNTNQDQNRYNQGYGSFRGNDYDDDQQGNRDFQNRSRQSGRDNEGSNSRDYGQNFDRNRDINDSGWNNWSHQSSPGNNYGQNEQGRRNDYNQDSRDFNRQGYGNGFSGSSDRNRDFDTFRNDYGQDRNQGSYRGDYGQGRSQSFGDDYNRSRDYGRFNQSQNYGRHSQSDDYGRNRGQMDFDNRRNRFGDHDRQDDDRGWWDRTKDEVSSWFGDDDAQRRREQDQRRDNTSSFRGKGPKDYKRSSERIREDVSDRLSDSHDVDASDIDVRVEGTEVILSGYVSNRNEKRRAEDIAEQVTGVTNVQNHLRVGQQQGSGTQNSNFTPGQQTGNSFGSGSTVGTTVENKSDSDTKENGQTGSSVSASMTETNKSAENKVKPEKANLS